MLGKKHKYERKITVTSRLRLTYLPVHGLARRSCNTHGFDGSVNARRKIWYLPIDSILHGTGLIQTQALTEIIFTAVQRTDLPFVLEVSFVDELKSSVGRIETIALCEIGPTRRHFLIGIGCVQGVLVFVALSLPINVLWIYRRGYVWVRKGVVGFFREG